MLNGSVTRLWTHGTLQAADGKSSLLQPIRNQIQEIHKLAKNNALCRRVLSLEIGELLDESFYL